MGSIAYGKAKIIERDMEDWQLQECVDCATYALHHFKDEQEVSEFMKKEFDKKYEPCWHVIVGQSFGAYLGHDIRKCAYFSIGCLFFVIFKSPDTEVPYIKADEEEDDDEGEGGEGAPAEPEPPASDPPDAPAADPE
jgi:dynein light chain LC8-type